MNALTPETKLTVDAAARLVGCSTKTLDRRRDAGLYELGAESAEEASRCEQLTAECKQLREEIVTTKMELHMAQVQARGMEKELEVREKEAAALRGQIVQLERLVKVLEGFAPKSMTATVK